MVDYDEKKVGFRLECENSFAVQLEQLLEQLKGRGMIALGQPTGSTINTLN
jgi:hypothetical protein